MAVSSFVRSTSHVPGTGDVQNAYYAEHSSGLCRLMIWRPSDTSFTNAKVFVTIHGGFGHNAGYRAMQPGTIHAALPTLCTNLSSAGWAVVSIDYPATSSNADSSAAANDSYILEYPPVVDIFEQAFWQARAISFLRDNWSGVAGRTYFGAALWGTNNTIDPNNVHVFGNSAGGTTALLGALAPETSYPFVPSGYALTSERYAPRSSGRPASVIGNDFQPDWTQFHIDTGTTSSLGVIYQQNIHQMFMRKQSGNLWSEVPLDVKKAASPWWWLRAGLAQNKTLPVFAFWSQSTNTEGLSLNGSHWNPGTLLSNSGASLAYMDPHHHFVGGPWASGSAGLLDKRSVTYWGNSTSNPSTPVPSAVETTMLNWLNSVTV